MCRLVRLSRDRGQSVIGMHGEVFPGVIMLCREARSQHGVVLITYPEWEMGEVVSYEGGDWIGGLEIHPVYIHLSMKNPTCNLYFPPFLGRVTKYTIVIVLWQRIYAKHQDVRISKLLYSCKILLKLL